MHKKFSNVEEVLTDEGFLSWYFKTDQPQAQEWESWMNSNPDQQPIVSEAISMMKAVAISENDLPVLKMETARERLLKTVQNGPRPAAKVVSMNRKRSRWWWAAAAAIVVLAAGSFFLRSNPAKPNFQTAYGEIRQNQLPDGSEVFLNANSAVEYTNEWSNGKDREVWVKGEAFFKVVQTVDRSRFIVHTDNFDVIVTGTQFNVINREDKTNVALTEGSITIHTKDGKSFPMKPGEFFEIKENKPVQTTIEKENVIAWQKKKLVFNNTPMREAARDLESLYGVKVKFQNETVGNIPITGMMSNDNLDVLLSALELTGDFKVTRNGNEILISTP